MVQKVVRSSFLSTTPASSSELDPARAGQARLSGVHRSQAVCRVRKQPTAAHELRDEAVGGCARILYAALALPAPTGTHTGGSREHLGGQNSALQREVAPAKRRATIILALSYAPLSATTCPQPASGTCRASLAQTVASPRAPEPYLRGGHEHGISYNSARRT